MSGILVVERSATLAHLLARTLQAAQFARWSELSSYGEALDHLRHSQTQGTPYPLLLPRTPPAPTRGFTQLLKFLQETRDPPLPVLVLAHEKTPELVRWVEGRHDATFVPWAQ